VNGLGEVVSHKIKNIRCMVKEKKVKFRLDKVYRIRHRLKSHLLTCDEKIVRQVFECVAME